MLRVISFFSLAVLLTACPLRRVEPVYTSYSPIFLKRADLEKSVEFQGPREMVKPAKIYVYGNYLFVGETNYGIHVIDNSSPANPVSLGFIRVPGNQDISIRNDKLYLNNAVDLVTLDVSDVSNPRVLSRLKEVFPELAPPDLATIPDVFKKESRPEEDMVIVGWEKEN